MKPIGFVSSFSASKQYLQKRSTPSQYNLGRSQLEQFSQSGRKLDRNNYKTPEKKANHVGISASATGAIGYSTPSLEDTRKRGQENENDTNERELAARKKNYIHYTADQLRLQRHSKNNADMIQQLSISARPVDISREENHSKENYQQVAHIPSRVNNSRNSYSGFISRSMNSSSFLQRQSSSINNSYHPAGNHKNMLSDSMISDFSPPKSRLNQSSVISTTEWQIPLYSDTDAQRKIDNNQKNSWNTFDYSVSAKKAPECGDLSLQFVSNNLDKRLCFSESKNSNYSMSQPDNYEKTRELRTLSQVDRNSKKESSIITELAQDKPQLTKTDDVFKSIHIDAKAALALLESLDTNAITSKKLSCLSYNDSSSWKNCQNGSVRQEDKILKNQENKSIPYNQRDILKTAAPQEGIITAITDQLKVNSSQESSKPSIVPVGSQQDKINITQPSSSEQQQSKLLPGQSPLLSSFEQHNSQGQQDKQTIIQKDMCALQILQLQQTQIKNSNDRQRAIQERIRRVDEITKKYSNLYQADINNNIKNNKKDTEEGKEKEIYNNKDKQETPLIQQQQQQQHQQYQEYYCQQTLEVSENTTTPRFPTIQGISYFTSAEQIRVFSASKNNVINTNDKQKETLSTKEEEQ